ncbi:MAG TPA: protein kinase [Blastocatellia bacterium]|nr:protein kinase [Blastocatellia bacterium]
MNAERYRRADQIFQSALDLDPAQRAAYLDDACAGDTDLRGEIEALIRSYEQAGSFLQSPLMETGEERDTNSLLGKSFGPYKVISHLGSGGMGEVYLAEDSRLSRKVALKLMPALYTIEEQQLNRFRQEARAASALNHPNIITIFEIGEADGIHFIAAEYIQGETLRERLSNRKVTTAEALDVAIQIAIALEAAHAAGIIHRDIKPENTMLRPDGYVKVLDFGLAKLTERRESTAEIEDTAGVAVSTIPGMIMGTASYMSPEQARGQKVDARTDIFSLGVVIYEMIAGCLPFEGDTTSDRIAAILKQEPPPLAHYSREVPAELERIVDKALRKDLEERYQMVKELASDLKDLKRSIEFETELERKAPPEKRSGWPQGVAVDSRHAATAERIVVETDDAAIARMTSGAAYVAGEIRHHRKGALLAALALLIAAAGIGYGLYRFIGQHKSIAPFQTTKITRLTTAGKTIHASISPDGKYVAYIESNIGQQSLRLRQTSATNDIPIIPPTSGGFWGITFSRDGNDLYYVHRENGPSVLYRIPVLGGTPTRLLTSVDSTVTFSPDGKQLAFVRGDYPAKGESALMIANVDGSGEQPLATRKLPESFYPLFFTGPSWSPDGQLIACALANYESGSRVDVVAFRVRDGKAQVLTRKPWAYIGRVEWIPDSSGLLIIAGENQAVITAAGSTAQIYHLSYPEGEVRSVTNDLNFYRVLSLTNDATKLVTVEMSFPASISIIPLNDLKGATQITSGKFEGYGTSFTPEGKIVFSSDAGGKPDIWIAGADGANRKQLTSNAGSNLTPSVSRDGRYIAFISDRTGNRNIWRMDTDGGNTVRLTSGLSDELPRFSPDGRWVVYSSLDPSKPGLWKVSVDGGDPVQITDKDAHGPAVSPDGKLIAFLSRSNPNSADQTARIALIPFEGGSPAQTFDIQNAVTLASLSLQIHWSSDGRALLYTSSMNNVSNIWSQPIDGGKPIQVTDFKENLILAFDLSPDGKKLVCSRGVFSRDAILISDLRE